MESKIECPKCKCPLWHLGEIEGAIKVTFAEVKCANCGNVVDKIIVTLSNFK